MKNLFILFITLILLSSCSNNKKNENSNTLNETIENKNINPEDIDGIFSVHPDSMSVEQKEKQHKVLSLLKESLILKDGRFYSNATKEDFERIGISESYYFMLQENLDEVNAMIKEDSLDAQKIYEEMIKDFSED